MSNSSHNGIEKALAMYTETVSPSKDTLVHVLNQIPEINKIKADDRRAIRSPYRWLAFAQVVSVLVVALAVYPNTAPTSQQGTQAFKVETENPFYEVDAQVEQFERAIDNEDYNIMVSDYTL